MAKQDNRETVERLAKELSRASSPEVLWMRELVSTSLELTKDKLMDADATEIVKLQGEARCLDRLFKNLTRPVGSTNEE